MERGRGSSPGLQLRGPRRISAVASVIVTVIILLKDSKAHWSDQICDIPGGRSRLQRDTPMGLPSSEPCLGGS